MKRWRPQSPALAPTSATSRPAEQEAPRHDRDSPAGSRPRRRRRAWPCAGASPFRAPPDATRPRRLDSRSSCSVTSRLVSAASADAKSRAGVRLVVVLASQPARESDDDGADTRSLLVPILAGRVRAGGPRRRPTRAASHPRRRSARAGPAWRCHRTAPGRSGEPRNPHPGRACPPSVSRRSGQVENPGHIDDNQDIWHARPAGSCSSSRPRSSRW